MGRDRMGINPIILPYYEPYNKLQVDKEGDKVCKERGLLFDNDQSGESNCWRLRKRSNIIYTVQFLVQIVVSDIKRVKIHDHYSHSIFILSVKSKERGCKIQQQEMS